MPDERPALASAVDAFTGMSEYALQVVTTVSADGEPSGCLVGFATQCSIVPPRFLVCLSKVNHTYFVSEHSDAVVIHLLGQDQTEVAALFAETTGDVVDKFERCRWAPGVTGAPVLAECAAWLEGEVLRRFSVGDHEALLVRPVAGGGGDPREVLTFRSSPPFDPGHPAGG